MKTALLLGVLAIVCACQSAPPKSAITKVAAGGAANLLTLPAGEGFSLSSRNYGAFLLRGRCLVLRYDNRDFTPVCKETPFPVRVTGTELTVCDDLPDGRGPAALGPRPVCGPRRHSGRMPAKPDDRAIDPDGRRLDHGHVNLIHILQL